MQNFLEELSYLWKFVAFPCNIPVFAAWVHYLQVSLVPGIRVFVNFQLLLLAEEDIILLVVLDVYASLLLVKLECIKFEDFLKDEGKVALLLEFSVIYVGDQEHNQRKVINAPLVGFVEKSALEEAF